MNKVKKTDIGLGLYILAAIVFLIMPLPNALLDILFAFNLAMALVILFNSLYAKEAMSMSAFPTMLLLTT